MTMKVMNVGSADRVLRFAIGVILVLLPVAGLVSSATATTGIIMIVAGAVLIVTGFASFCPLYRIIGASTR